MTVVHLDGDASGMIASASSAGRRLDRFVLGTAQLGMAYGIANRTGQPSYAVASGIVRAAYDAGVRWFDTARRYGDAESLLGRIFGDFAIANSVRIVSKLGCDPRSREAVSRDIDLSLELLGVDRLSALLLHDEEALDWWHDGVGANLVAARSGGRIEQIGVSVYSAERALQALSIPEIDCLQVPFNVFDRRMLKAGVFERGRATAKTIFVRSVYLQGLALAERDSLNIHFPDAREASATYAAFCREHGVQRPRFAVDYVRWQAPEALPVIGVETVEQLVETLDAFSVEGTPPELRGEWDRSWPRDDDQLVDPRRWPNA